jgi:phosphoribosylformylglycinamidine (FGAM) synthase-like enzyme
VIKHGGEVKADLPIKELGDEAPLYDRPHWVPQAAGRTPPAIVPLAEPPTACAPDRAPDLARKRWVYEQYDT